MKKWVVWLCMGLAVLGSGGESMAADHSSLLQKPNVQHMQVITQSPEESVIVDTWQDVEEKHTRIDLVAYGQSGGAATLMSEQRSVTIYQGQEQVKWPFELALRQGENKEFSRDIFDPFNISNSKRILFEASARSFEGARWEHTGTSEIDGKQVKQLRRTYTTKDGGSAVAFAYTDPATGMPVKEEHYLEGDSTPAITKLYRFEEIRDPTGFLFTNAAASLLQTEAADWLLKALDSLMPMDDALNFGMKYIAIDLGGIPGLNEAAKQQVLRSFKKYKVATMDSSLAKLREQGLYNRKNTMLDGVLLRVYKIEFVGDAVMVRASKYRSGDGAIGVKVMLEKVDGNWKVTRSDVVGIS